MEYNTIVTLKKGEGRSLKAGGAWIYDNEIADIKGSFKNGAIIRVQDFDGYPMGKGFINQNSKIRVRMLTRGDETIDELFLERRIRAAWEYRKTVMYRPEDLNCCRLIFGEADGFPGLVIDKYADVLVVECLALGMDQLKDTILKLTARILAEDGIEIRGIYERSDAPVRKKEGLLPYKGFISPEFDTDVEIVENGIHFLVDVMNGQKTGFFLDQKYNRLAVRKAAEGKTVLDCCTHTGSFALNAAKGGALSVTAADISASALAMTERNAQLNGVSLKTVRGDVFDLLPKLSEEHAFFDFIILDPPAFTKSSKTFRSARAGYRQINAMAMRLLPRGGYLATCSCSHFMPKEEFRKMLKDAADDAGVGIRIAEERGASPDHPVLPAVPQTEYLKFFLVQII